MLERAAVTCLSAMLTTRGLHFVKIVLQGCLRLSRRRCDDGHVVSGNGRASGGGSGSAFVARLLRKRAAHVVVCPASSGTSRKVGYDDVKVKVNCS
jgi:hypothetical protein